MIVHVKYGKHKLAIYYILYKDIKMLYILWHLIYLMGTYIIYYKYSDRIATGSFDKTAKLWDVNTGQCLYTFVGHQN